MFTGIREQVIGVSGTASTALKIQNAELQSSQRQVQLLIAGTAGLAATVAIGGSSVSANNTVDGTTKLRADGMFTVPVGIPIPFMLKDTDTHISIIAADGSSTLTAYVLSGYGDRG